MTFKMPDSAEPRFWEWSSGEVTERVYRAHESVDGSCGWEGATERRFEPCKSRAVSEGFCAWHHRAAAFSAAAAVPLRDPKTRRQGEKAHAGSKRMRTKLAGIAAGGRVPTAEDAGIVLV